MAKNTDITVIICTHNRADLLSWSLPTYRELDPILSFELLVVLNACTDRSLEVLKELQSDLPQLRWVEENELGLSAARNKGAAEASSDWVVYIDDDATPRKDLLVHIKEVMDEGSYEAFSGHTHFVRYNSPKWIQGKDIEAPVHAPHLMDLPPGAFMNGCICGFKTRVLTELGGFDPKYGMKGKHTAYGEEVDLQFRLQYANKRIAYHPQMVVHHRSHFNSLGGLMKAAFLKGRYMQYLRPQTRWKHLLKGIGFGLWGLFTFFPLWVEDGFQRAALDSFGDSMYHFGRTFSFSNQLPKRNSHR